MKELNKAQRRARSRIKYLLGLDEGLTDEHKQAKLARLIVDCRLACKGLGLDEDNVKARAINLYHTVMEDTEENA